MKRNDDIVAFIIDDRWLVREYRCGENVRVVTRAHMRLMAACDLGPQWKEVAEASAIALFRPGVPTDTLTRIRP